MPFDQGAPQFGVADAKIATWTSTDVYGTLTDIMGIQMAQASINIVSAIANGDDRIVAAASRIVGATLQMRFVGMNPTSMSILTGVAISEGPVGFETVLNMQFTGGERLPYFGAIIKSISEEIGDTWVFLPKCKIMSDFSLFAGEFGTFTTPEVSVQAVIDETWGLANFITHPADLEITVIPPANIIEIT